MSDDATPKTKSPLAGLSLTFLAPAADAQTTPAVPLPKAPASRFRHAWRSSVRVRRGSRPRSMPREQTWSRS